MDILQEIWSGLKRNKLRTVLTGLSVSWGIFILIILLGASNGLKNGVTSNFRGRATNTVQLWTWVTSKPYKGYQSGRGLSFTEKELHNLEEHLEEVNDPTPIINKTSNITFQSEYGSYNIRGILPSYKQIY